MRLLLRLSPHTSKLLTAENTPLLFRKNKQPLNFHPHKRQITAILQESRPPPKGISILGNAPRSEKRPTSTRSPRQKNFFKGRKIVDLPPKNDILIKEEISRSYWYHYTITTTTCERGTLLAPRLISFLRFPQGAHIVFWGQVNNEPAEQAKPLKKIFWRHSLL